MATVSKGKVTFKKKGTVIITAKAGKKTQKFKVTYKGTKNNTSIITVTLKKGKSKALKVLKNKSFKWKSKNKKVAIVSKGKVKALSKGKTVITIFTKGKTQKIKMTVQ